MRTPRLGYLAAAIALLLFSTTCSHSPSGPTPGGGGSGNTGGGGGSTGLTVTMLGVGDIGMCGSPAVEQTARLVAGLEGDLILAGDIAYPQGTAVDFRDCFNPFWGQFRSRWHAVPGNHEYESANAAPFYAYFGGAAAPPSAGYFSFMSGDWVILMLNSNIPATRGSPQWEFVRAELEKQRTPCTMAVWHHPLFSSGPNGSSTFMRDMWELLEAARVEVILNGHDHLYERFARQTAAGVADPVAGIRQITAGTGGAELYNLARLAANSEERLTRHGVVRFTLRPALFEWEFIGVDDLVADRGLDTCR